MNQPEFVSPMILQQQASMFSNPQDAANVSSFSFRVYEGVQLTMLPPLLAW